MNKYNLNILKKKFGNLITRQEPIVSKKEALIVPGTINQIIKNSFINLAKEKEIEKFLISKKFHIEEKLKSSEILKFKNPTPGSVKSILTFIQELSSELIEEYTAKKTTLSIKEYSIFVIKLISVILVIIYALYPFMIVVAATAAITIINSVQHEVDDK